MKPFTVHSGVAAPLLEANIDTDAIIPSREMKRVSKKGLSEGLFANWRYAAPGSRELVSDFVLNQARYAGTTILLAGPNFGCGSSREHAVWALAEYGIRAIVAPSFGSIFQKNCVGNGILCAVLDAAEVEALSDWSSDDPQVHRLDIDLPNQTITGNASHGFTIEAADKEQLISGLDAIDATLAHAASIKAFEENHWTLQPWVRLP